jgi:hypothetical protein
MSEFRYLARGGPGGEANGNTEPGGPGTVFIYHKVEEHRTLIIDNDGLPNPRTDYVNWDNLAND